MLALYWSKLRPSPGRPCALGEMRWRWLPALASTRGSCVAPACAACISCAWRSVASAATSVGLAANAWSISVFNGGEPNWCHHCAAMSMAAAWCCVGTCALSGTAGW